MRIKEQYSAELCENCIHTQYNGETLEGYDDQPLTKLPALSSIECDLESAHFNPGNCDGCELTLGHNSYDCEVIEWLP